MKATKKSKMQKTDSDLKEEEQLKAFLMIVPDEEGIIIGLIIELHRLVMKRFEHQSLEGIDLILVGSLRLCYKANAKMIIERIKRMEFLRVRNFYDNIHSPSKFNESESHDGSEEGSLSVWLYNHTTNVPYSSPCLITTRSASPSKTASGKTSSNPVIVLIICQKLYGNQLTMLHSKELASPKQTALGKDISNPLIVDSLLKTIWLSMHHVIAMKHWLFQSKRLLGRIVGFQKFLQLSAATYTSYYCQFYLVLLMKNAIDSRK
ncbi:hypothetical protein Tco_1244445 [Tanacetum coccineum]